MSRKAVIAGAGIGGLGAAIALGLRGWDVQVLERAPALTEVGAGVQIGPNGVRLLEALGVMPALEPWVFEPKAIEARRGRTGQRFFHLPMGEAAVARWGTRYLQMHRADLLGALEKRLAEVAPDAIVTGHSITGYDDTALLTQSGHRFAGDLLIGADGLRSVIRSQMLGPDAPRYTGATAWRCLVEDPEICASLPDVGCIWTGPGRHAVTTKVRGGRVVNFVGVVDRPEPVPEDWETTAPKAAAVQDFAEFVDPIPRLLDRAHVIHRWGLYDRAPLPRWSDGPVALIGDAAHPMVPSMAQGAVQAIEDAWVLADELDQTPDVADGLRRYFDRRIARATAIQRTSARNLRRFHLREPYATGLYSGLGLVSWAAPGLLARQYDWIYGHKV